MSRTLLAAAAVLRMSASSAVCAPRDSACAAALGDETGLLQKPAAQPLEPKELETCSEGDHVQCPGSDAWCRGEQCCPGTEVTGHKSFPCPSAKAGFGLGSCATGMKLAHCTKKDQKPAPMPTPPKNCLCTFDIDRTLTGKQGHGEQCPANSLTGVFDSAYGGGKLMLSAVGQGVCKTFCSECYVGIVTAGDATGEMSEERVMLVEALQKCGKLPSMEWAGPSLHGEARANCDGAFDIDSTLVVGCNDATKQFAVEKMLKWLSSKKGINIADEDVYHYDDRAMNVVPFGKLGYNARQISCASRDLDTDGGRVGLCGAEVEEISNEKGIFLCPGFHADAEGSIHYRPNKSPADLDVDKGENIAA